MLEAVVKHAGLHTALDAVLSVHSRGIFKPHPSVYQLAIDRLEVKPADVAFVSSNAWDASGAASFGFRVFWINRTGATYDQLGYPPVAKLTALDQLLQHTV
jgi:2-haloacid dehalogenase